MARKTEKTMKVNALKAAARMADIDSLYRVVEQDPQVLKYIDSMQFVETPLHVVAASVDLCGHIHFAIEIMRLKPSFALKLNPQGLTPIHLAIENSCNKMAFCLVHFNKDVLRAKMRGGLTPLHLATQYGNIGLLFGFLEVCPNSIEDLTLTGETALHLAVKYNFEAFVAFKFLVRWLKTKPQQLKRTILDRRDEDGNTILHIAALNDATEVMEFLREEDTIHEMDFDAQNLRGETAVDLSRSARIKIILDEARVSNGVRSVLTFLHRSWSFLKKKIKHFFEGPITEQNRNTYLVVATLIATATYQAVLSPPGGFHQSDSVGTNQTLAHLPSNSSFIEGKSVMSHSDFRKYRAVISTAFLLSTATIVVMLPKRYASFLLYLANGYLIYSFHLSLKIISPPEYILDFSKFSESFLLAIVVMIVWVAFFMKPSRVH